MKLKLKQILLMGITATALWAVSAVPSMAANTMEDNLKKITDAMTMLGTIADSGVAIVIVPFSIGYALKIAGHIMQHA